MIALPAVGMSPIRGRPLADLLLRPRRQLHCPSRHRAPVPPLRRCSSAWRATAVRRHQPSGNESRSLSRPSSRRGSSPRASESMGSRSLRTARRRTSPAAPAEGPRRSSSRGSVKAHGPSPSPPPLAPTAMKLRSSHRTGNACFSLLADPCRGAGTAVTISGRWTGRRKVGPTRHRSPEQ